MSSPNQMFSRVEATAIVNSPLNTSSAKQHWSFARDQRFKLHKYYCDSYYEIPGIKENKNRMAAFGYGRKTDLETGKHPHNQSPSPDTYHLSSFIDSNKLHNKGFTQLMSREQVAPLSYIEIEPKKVPGPGRYEEYRLNYSPRWSFHQRTSDLFPKTLGQMAPGPGSYQNLEAIENRQTGHFYLSTHRSSQSKVFNPPCSKRFNRSTANYPGPGIYHPHNDLSNEGKYVLSKNLSAGKRKFLQGRRLSFTDITARRSFTPGPGSYRSPSQFGQYDVRKKVRNTSSKLSQRLKASCGQTDVTHNLEKSDP